MGANDRNRKTVLKKWILYIMPPCKYQSHEERSSAYKSQQNNYSKKDWKCDVCDCVINLGNKTNHLSSKKHLKNQSSTSSDSANENFHRTWRCDVCDIEINLRSRTNHLKSQRHLRNESARCEESDGNIKSVCSSCNENESDNDSNIDSACSTCNESDD